MVIRRVEAVGKERSVFFRGVPVDIFGIVGSMAGLSLREGWDVQIDRCKS